MFSNKATQQAFTKVNNRNTRIKCKIYPNSTKKTPVKDVVPVPIFPTPNTLPQCPNCHPQADNCPMGKSSKYYRFIMINFNSLPHSDSLPLIHKTNFKPPTHSLATDLQSFA